MTLRDDMVFRPSLGRQHVAAAPVRAREERKLAGAKRKGGILHRLVQAKTARRAAAARARAKSGQRTVRATRFGQAGLARGAAGGAGRAAAAGGSIAAIAAAIVVAGVVTFRLLSGEPLEKTGEQINSMLLGDLDDEARAKMATRQQLQGNADLMRFVGRDGVVSAQVASVAEDITKMNMRREVGASKLREEFPVNNTLDMLIERAKVIWEETWGDGSGEVLWEALKSAWRGIAFNRKIIPGLLRFR